MQNRLATLLIALLFFSSAFSLISFIPVGSAAAPSSSISNPVYINGTLTGTTGGTTGLPKQTLTITAPEGSAASVNLNNPIGTYWALSNGDKLATLSFSLGSYRYYSGSGVRVYGFEFQMGIDPNIGGYNIGTAYANLTIGSHTYSYSHTYNVDGQSSHYAEISSQWGPSLASGIYSVSVQYQVTSDPNGDTFAGQSPAGGQTSTYTNFPYTGGGIYSTYYTQGSNPDFIYPFTYSNTPSNSYSPALPTGTSSYSISWTSQYSSILNVNGGNVGNSGTSGSYTESSSNSYPIKLVSQSNPDAPSYTGTVQVTADSKTSVSQSYNSGPISQTITQNINWWNASSVSKTIPLPSGWNSGASFSGSIHHILSVGYGTNARSDRLNLGGYSSYNWNPVTAQYQSKKISGTVNSGGLSISANTSEFITYGISVTPTPVPYSSVEQSPVTVSIKYSSQITLSEIQLYVNGNLMDRYTSPGSSGTASLALSDPSFSPLQVDWFLTTGEYSEWHNYTYGGATTPAANASSIIVLQSPNATHSYPITLSGVPHGVSYPISITTDSPNSSLTYQQELLLNTSGLGINSNLGNQLFTFSNGTKAYAWIQSYNSSSKVETVWVKMHSEINQTLNWNIYPSSFNWLNATGYLGEAPQMSPIYAEYDNGYSTFGTNKYTDFSGTNLPSFLTGYNYVLNNGVYLNDSGMVYSSTPMASGYFGTNMKLWSNSTHYNGFFLSYYKTSQAVNMTYIAHRGGANTALQFDNRINGTDYFSTYTNSNMSKSNDLLILVPSLTPTITYGWLNGVETNITPSPHFGRGGVYPQLFRGGDIGLGAYFPYFFQDPLSTLMPTASVGSGSNFQPSGYYDQEINVTNPSQYGLNAENSNFQIVSGNGTTLYTWIQSENQGTQTNMTLWTKTPYSSTGSETLQMEVMPSFENLLSSNGYLGEAPQLSSTYAGYDNSKYIGFPLYDNFQSSTLNTSIWVSSHLSSDSTFGNGWHIADTTSFNEWIKSGEMPQSEESYLYVQSYNHVSGGTPTTYWENTTSSQAGSPITGTGIYSFAEPNSLNLWMPFYPSGGSGYYNISYTFVSTLNSTSMPTASISGSGSAFMANATTTSSYPGVPGSYATNGTYQNMIYNIPIAPNTVYLTAIINSTWQFVSLYPSTYHIFGNMVLFTDLTGFASISIETIQPAQELGKVQESVTLSLLQNGNPQNELGYQYTASYFSSSVTYTPYGSTSSVTLSSMGMSFSLPYGASAKVQVYDYWGEQVGSASFSVPQTSITVDVSVNVTLLYTIDNETGATFLSMGLRQGATNLSNGPDPMYVANGSSYEWYISTMNPQTFQNQLYSNTVTASGQTCVTKVPIGAPVSTLTVEAEGYNGSGLNKISNAGPAQGAPTAYLYLNGVRTFFGQTFEGTYGETVSVRITDVLGHTLYSGSVLLNSPTISERYNITVPSYLIQFVNLEAVNGTSPLATQYSSISVANTTGPYYNFTTHVGLWSQIYLAAGYTYFVSTHDNLTATRYIDLTNQTIAYAFNGSSIQPMSESQFQASSAYLSVDVGGGIQGTIQANVTNAFTITVYLHKAALAYSLTKQQTEWVMANTTVVLQLDGVKETLVPPYGDMYGNALVHYVSPGILRVDVNISELRGGFSLNVTISNTTLAGVTVSGNGLENFGTVNYNPSNPPKPITGPDINAWLHSPAVEVLGILSVIGGITAFGWKRLTRKETDEEEDLNQATLVVEGILAAKVMAGDPLTEMEQAWWNAIPGKTKQKLMHGGTAGKRTLFPRFKPTRLPGTGKR